MFPQLKLETIMGGLPTIGATNPDAYISDELWSAAWQHELSVLTRQIAPVIQDVDGNQILNLCLFWSATIGYQIMRHAAQNPEDAKAQHQLRLIEKMVRAAQVFTQLHDEAGTFEKAAGVPVLLLPDTLGPEGIDMLDKAFRKASTIVV